MVCPKQRAFARHVGGALAVALLGVAPRALAEPVPPAAQRQARATQVDAVERYHEAFARLARGDRAGAIERLRELIEAAPNRALAGRARALLTELEPREAAPAATDGATPEDLVAEPPAAEKRTGAARAELTLFQTLHGGVLGAEVCLMAECEEARPWVLALMLGAGAGFTASFALSDGGVRPGLARALSDGTVFGGLNGVWAVLLRDDSDPTSTTIGGYLALGQIAGLGLGGLLYDQLRPTTGQVSLAASGGLWVPVAAAELVGAFGAEMEADGWGALLLATTNGGLAAGGWLASEVPTSASRALLIDGGGVLGTLTGLGLGVIAQGDDIEPEPTFALGFAGTLGGLALAYVLTQSWDPRLINDTAALHFGVTPRADGGMSAQLGGSW